ncbi:MAG: efflux RND transporter permease subunit [Akkermansiaceae bacterium]|jgi:multidrug efflux pump subunit AcrB|nr:efflux RND transporter permease subunit [Akkermansiaceae bacterium]
MIGWFARNDIAANFLMLGIVFAGIWTAMNKIPLEVQPGMRFQEVWVNVDYRGGSPEDVERAVILPIELALEGLTGVKSIESKARADFGEVRILLKDQADPREVMDEVQLRVDSIATFPDEIEPPQVYVPDTAKWFDVIKIAITGNMEDPDLAKAARRVRDDILEMPGISQAAVQGESRQEISIEANLARLRDFNLGFADLADAVRRSSIDLPAGRIQTDEGAMIIRSKGQAFSREDYENIVISNTEGATVRLRDVATINDGYEEGGKILRFNGRPALLVEALRLNDESAIEIADKVKAYAAEQRQNFPEGIELHVWDDSSVELRGRLGTLFSSMLQGGILVLLVLGLFLRPSLAFWVTLGIPISFAGGLALMPSMDITLNSMSTFGFIIVVGLVVDDAIVTAENVYTKLREGVPAIDAAVDGAKEVAVPVTFGALTTVVAFLPLLSFDGFYGNLTRQIPPVVAAVLLVSLIESKLVLPSHLKHIRVHRTRLGPFARFQKSIADGLESFIQKVYRPSLIVATRHRYTTTAVFIALGMACVGLAASGRLGFVNMPSLDRNRITARIQMPRDTPVEITDQRVQKIAAAVDQLRKDFIDPGTGQSLIGDVLTSAGGHPGRPWSDPREGYVMISITDPGDRSEPGPKNTEIAARWTELVGEVPDAQSFFISGDRGGGMGGEEEQELEIQLRGPDSESKADIAEKIVEEIESYQGIASAWNDAGRLRPEIHVSLKPEGKLLGLTQAELGRQIRSAFFGDQAQRLQRGRDDIRVMVRLPKEQRESLQTLEDFRIRTPDGGHAPLHSVANVSLENARADISRIDGAQVTSIEAEPEDETVDIIRISRDLESRINLLLSGHPELSWVYDGYIREHQETNRRIWISGIALFLALYALLAIPFKNLLQPFIVLLAVPFGVIGALVGHLILDLTPSYLSVFGMLALAGVVVNDSLVMVDFANQRRRAGDLTMEAVTDAGSRRFRPILLTSLTTFVGLLPLMLDRSLQAQMLIPMAVSLGFGVLFATFITLYLIPSAYLIMEDAIALTRRTWTWYRRPFASPPNPSPNPGGPMGNSQDLL